jgi:hypothetical protein
MAKRRGYRVSDVVTDRLEKARKTLDGFIAYVTSTQT